RCAPRIRDPLRSQMYGIYPCQSPPPACAAANRAGRIDTAPRSNNVITMRLTISYLLDLRSADHEFRDRSAEHALDRRRRLYGKPDFFFRYPLDFTKFRQEGRRDRRPEGNGLAIPLW